MAHGSCELSWPWPSPELQQQFLSWGCPGLSSLVLPSRPLFPLQEVHQSNLRNRIRKLVLAALSNVLFAVLSFGVQCWWQMGGGWVIVVRLFFQLMIMQCFEELKCYITVKYYYYSVPKKITEQIRFLWYFSLGFSTSVVESRMWTGSLAVAV